jgi:hypothetical protein
MFIALLAGVVLLSALLGQSLHIINGERLNWRHLAFGLRLDLRGDILVGA